MLKVIMIIHMNMNHEPRFEFEFKVIEMKNKTKMKAENKNKKKKLCALGPNHLKTAHFACCLGQPTCARSHWSGGPCRQLTSPRAPHVLAALYWRTARVLCHSPLLTDSWAQAVGFIPSRSHQPLFWLWCVLVGMFRPKILATSPSVGLRCGA